MCLCYIKTEKEKEEWLKTQPETMTVYKIVTFDSTPSGEKYLPPFRVGKSYYLKYGVNEVKDPPAVASCSTNGHQTYYDAGFHFFTEHWKAVDLLEEMPRWANKKIVTCIVKKEDVTAVGIQDNFLTTKEYEVVVANKFTFKQSPKKEAPNNEAPK